MVMTTTEQIFDTNEEFDFNKMVLSRPSVMAGGNHFIRFYMNQQPLYIQPPKCKTKQGIIKAGKRFYTDLMFTNENEKFIQWMENLESYCQDYIHKNKKEWFDGEMEMHDIENYFTSPLKIYKSGKYYIARVNITPILGKSTLKIYDENEQEVAGESLSDSTNVMTILEIQGIKCSARSFQIEMEMKQMMVLNPVDIFEKCLLKTKPAIAPVIEKSSLSVGTDDNKNEHNNLVMNNEKEIVIETASVNTELMRDRDDNVMQENEENVSTELVVDTDNTTNAETSTDLDNTFMKEDNILADLKDSDGMEEIDFHLDELPESETVQIKARNDVYYEMYREARRKAKIARDLALSSYLEAKRIKNTYMLDDIKDSDDSDFESDDENDENDEDEKSPQLEMI